MPILFVPLVLLVIGPMRMPYADEEKGYPDVKLDQLATGKWLRPRARIIGEVVFKKREEDGDLHLSLKDGNHFVVCEFIPELMPEDLPSVNDRVEIWASFVTTAGINGGSSTPSSAGKKRPNEPFRG